jgi:hypothetical protein
MRSFSKESIMSSILVDYQRVPYNQDSNGDDPIYTCTTNCFIFVDPNSGDPEGPFDTNRIYAAANGARPERNLAVISGTADDLAADQWYGTFSFVPGDVIRVFRNNESAVGVLHVFRFPDAE